MTIEGRKEGEEEGRREEGEEESCTSMPSIPCL